ncbi:MAG: hypothetical protein E6525_27915, partial [Klebsiella grimontii]|nr:hypothetical protein [Klebsiella grimontii]
SAFAHTTFLGNKTNYPGHLAPFTCCYLAANISINLIEIRKVTLPEQDNSLQQDCNNQKSSSKIKSCNKGERRN